MAHLLIVDDERDICTLIEKYAKFEGHKTTTANSGMQAVNLARENHYDLIIMDVMMPQLDGFSASKEIRKKANTPILMLSARGEEYDRIHGFEVGIDDYVVKPFSPKELMLRVNAILKRAQGEVEAEVFTHKGLEVNFTARTVAVNKERLQMSPKEYDLLFYLVKNKNVALTREKLITEVWGYDFFGDDRTLDTHIKLVRKQLGEYSHLIVTMRGVGYKFETE